ncbi:MAG TPA: hypothetical protein VGF79_02250 [Bacteroidia bacterium]
MSTITSEAFYNAWKEAVKADQDYLLKIWRNNRDFTYKMMGDEDSMISKVAKKLGLESYEQDYYSIDSILYKKGDLINNPYRAMYWFKEIRVAFEHENSFNRGILEEVAHLLITNAELKVLVTYPNDTPIEELKEIYEIIRSSGHSKSLTEKQNFMIIFGYEPKFEWEFFIYDENNPEWNSYERLKD